MDYPWRHTGPVSRPLAERLDEKTDRSGGPDACWPWLGARNSKGRAVIQIDRRAVYVTRHVLAATIGRPLAEGEFACHACDNPPCVNPAHLFAAAHRENMSDMAAKGRASRAPKPAAQRAKAGAAIRAYFAAHPGALHENRVTHCPKGHAYAGDNLRTRRDGSRRCRTCDNARNRDAWARRHTTA